MVKLSVVVPFYNVETYLREALESVSRQTLRDFEVIMVDDGSTDGSALIAESFAARDPRYRLLTQHNQGQGPARNLGVRHATGEYLAFFDADDVLPGHAYELLVGSLEETGSDIAAGNVLRFSTGWVSRTVVHADVYRNSIPHTTVSQHPALLRDCTIWNKVYRRSFWMSAQLEYSARRYEDIPVAIRSYVLARSVDIRHETVYYWRARETGELSRNQRSRQLENVEGRMAAVLESGTFLAERAPAIKPVFDRRVLDNDLAVLVRAVEFASETERVRMLELAADYLRSVDDAVFRDAPVMHRLRYYLIREGMHADFLDVLRYSRSGDSSSAPLVRLGRKWYIGYPYLDDVNRGIPREIYEASREMELNVQLDAVSWHDGRLRIEGYAYIRRLHAPRRQDTRIEVTLRNTVIHRNIRLKVTRIERPDVTARSGQSAACYDWSGFMVEIKPERLSNLGTWRAASWELRVRVRGHGVRRDGPVSSITPGSASLPEGRWAGGGVWLQPAPEHDRRFLIRAARPGAVATACHADGDELRIEGWSAVPIGKKAAIVISLQRTGGRLARVPAVATGESSGRYGFRASVPVPQLITAGGDADGDADGDAIDELLAVAEEPGQPAAGELAQSVAGEPVQSVAGEPVQPAAGEPGQSVAEDVRSDLALDPGTGHAVRLAGEPGAAGIRLGAGAQEITTYLTPFGNLSAVQRARRLVVRQATWTEADELILRGDWTDAQTAPSVIMLRSNGYGYQHAVPLRWQDGEFSACLSPGSMPGQAGELPLASGRWELLTRTPAGEARVVADRGLTGQMPAPRQCGIHAVTVEIHRGDAVRLGVRLASRDVGRYAQRQLQQWYSSPAARTKIDDLVVFDSHGGKQYSCNPRAIYEELLRRDTGLATAWVSRDGQVCVPDGGRAVVYASREHYELLGRARFIVSNMLLPEWYRRTAGQLFLQTWHGTPLKRICLDVENPQFAKGLAYHDRVRQDVANWNALLSPNAFSTPIFRKAFGFDGDILEFGYPRNDLLCGPGTAEQAARIRRQLGLPAAARIVLYAPTWRDDATTRAGGYGFPQHLDLGALARALGDDHVVLVRAHPKMKEALVTGGGADDRVVDVTRYPDMADLLVIADVLISDYSSAMFDFAVTGRPMLFFTYDLERYRDKLRGFYFDFEAEAPGPLLRTSDEVTDALRNLDDVNRSYRAAYDGFAARFCALEDGGAAARSVDWLLSRAAT
ncbi:MAG TPA: bifunctional glycosyltransferase family 2 protein/CDP-glycerol:glycerophosphate glycerophosphotransferase [Streptosporangiaceae bacterium]|jgi:CDP-glycerol glycerophosphotransferase